MDKFLIISKIIAMISVSILCLALTVLAVRANKTINKLNTLAYDTDTAAKRLPLLEKQTEYLIENAGLAANEARKASIKESKILDAVNAKVQSTLVHLDQFVVTSTKNESELMATANTTVKAIQPVLADTEDTLRQTTEAVAALQTTISDVDKVVLDPSIPKTLEAVERSSEATADTMTAAKGTAQDVQQAVHKYLHPKWYQTLFSWTFAAASGAAKVFAP